MSWRVKLAKTLIGKRALSVEDFGGQEGLMGFTQLMGGKKVSGQIPWNNYTLQRQEYRGTTYAGIKKIGAAVSSASLHLFVPDGNSDVRKTKRIPVADERLKFLKEQPFIKRILTPNENAEEITDHAALDVFKKANGSMTRSQLMLDLVINLMLNGNCYWEPIENEAGAFPAQIRVWLPTQMKPITKGGMTNGYKVRLKMGNTKKFKLEEIVHFFYPNPHSQSEGFSPVSAASQRISGEVNTAAFQNSTLENMGIPAHIVKIMRRMEPDAFEEFKTKWGDMFRSAGKTGFTQGEWELVVMGQTLQEMGYIEGSKMLREFIANTLEVPISKLTMESSNRAVADAGNTEFLRDTILPNLVMIAEEMTESLIPMFPSLDGTDAFYMFDNPVPEDLRLKIMARRVNRTTGVTTPNEERAEDGLEPHPSEEAESLAPVRAIMPEQGEQAAVRAIDIAVDKAIDDMRNGSCDH